MGILEYNISFLSFLSLLHERIIIWYIRINLLLGCFFTLLPRTVAFPRRFFLGAVLAYLAP